MKEIKWLTIFSAFLFMIACNKEEDTPEMVSYANDIRPILDQQCIACHFPGGLANSSGVFLIDYASTKTAVGLTKGNQNLVLGSINHLNGFSPMPQSAPKLSSTTIRKIEDWINAGAPNN